MSNDDPMDDFILLGRYEYPPFQSVGIEPIDITTRTRVEIAKRDQEKRTADANRKLVATCYLRTNDDPLTREIHMDVATELIGVARWAYIKVHSFMLWAEKNEEVAKMYLREMRAKFERDKDVVEAINEILNGGHPGYLECEGEVDSDA